MRIIGLLGRKGAGKNFVADRIAEIVRVNGSAAEQAAFADPIKRFCIDILGLPEDKVYGNDQDKNWETQYRWERLPENVRRKNGKDSGALSIRHVMQAFGTDLGRDVWSKDIWIDAMRNKIEASKRKHLDGRTRYFVITDVRMDNEIDAVRSWGGQVWKIDGDRAGDRTDGHPTEDIDRKSGDIVIVNSMKDTAETINHKVLTALKETYGPL